MENQTLASIVSDDISKAAVLEHYGLDYCCGGKSTLKDACTKQNLDINKVIKSLDEFQPHEESKLDFESIDLDEFVDYIVKKHHRYIRQQIPTITAHLAKINSVHGKKHPELAEIEQLFNESAQDLSSHLLKEENVLFPFIQKLANQQTINFDISQPIAMMESEHDTEGERFKRISKLTNQYQTPADGCNTYKFTMKLLHDFEKDLHRHIHLENNILFPRALALYNAS